MLRYGNGSDQQQMNSEGAATGVFSAETQSQDPPGWQTEQQPLTTTNSTNVMGPNNPPSLSPSAAMKTNIVCLPPEATAACTNMECSPVTEQRHVSNAAQGAAFSSASFGTNQAPAPAPSAAAIVTPESSSVSLQQFEDAPEDEGQYCHLPRLDPRASGPESRLQPRTRQDENAKAADLPQRPTFQKQQRQSSLDALAMVCDFENRATPASANAVLPSAASSTYSASMSLGTNDQEDTGTTSSASTQVMSNASYVADVANNTTSSNRRDDAFPASDTSAPSSSTTNSFQFSHSDVLCGRGGLTNHHPGNVLFRKLVRSKQEEYLRATKRDKAGVAREIVDTIRRLDPPGRFLKKDPSNPGQWIEIGNRKAREKTSQALREGAPELREELNEAAAANGQTSQQQTRQQQQSNLFIAPHTSATCEGMTMAEPMSAPPALRGRKVTEEGPAVAAALAEAMSNHPEQVQSEQHPPQIHPQGYAHPAPPPVNGPHQIYDETTPQEQSFAAVVPMDTSATCSSGNKRKLDEDDQYTQARRSPMPEACALQEHRAHEEHGHDQRQEEPCPSPGGTRGKGGPRIKMLKERMRDFPCVQ